MPIARTSGRLAAAVFTLVLALATATGPVHAEGASDPAAPPPPGGPTAPAAPFIIGGTKSPPGAWPSVVALMYSWPGEDESYHVCGGTIIDPSWVLTAAHCVVEDGPVDPRGLHVLVGTQDLRSGGQRIPVSQVVVRPSFSWGNLQDDVALLRLARPTDRPRALEVASGTDIPASGANLTAVGWGMTDLQTGAAADELRQVDLPALDSGECRAAIDELLDEGLDIPSYHSSHLCAGEIGVGGEGPCYGDSGGPLVWETGGRKVLVGISSWVPNHCASPEGPTVFSKVASASRWIAQTIRFGPHRGEESFFYATAEDYFDPSVVGNGWDEPTIPSPIVDPGAHIAAYHATPAVTRRDATIVRLYQAILGRRAEVHGYDYWRQRILWNGGSALRVAEVMARSQEFRTNYGQLSPEDFVEQLYLNLLGRSGAPADVTYWTGRLAAGASRGQVAMLIAESPENRARHRAEVDVQVMFLNLLGRAPAAYELDQWRGRPLAELGNALVHSVAYARRHAGYWEI